ncbi:uncharacterized protein Z518_03741 [Rhinocladiella mackenziei CBS 650.93]|uniref:Uncharacterized protein n=1 Tax=Rhinocladiella mackenziei CBS 650.93 TaxID=1442369 RepID=A0A0D2IJ53_9EURO|nr:uncharacterized protein Z518_03741 [Rhinocladiella mackenziei CBS 650.93]KIX05769.1 hypothetical protein Z518_03741 [Rhinocladiella mackenziei CBS 650.93]
MQSYWRVGPAPSKRLPAEVKSSGLDLKSGTGGDMTSRLDETPKSHDIEPAGNDSIRANAAPEQDSWVAGRAHQAPFDTTAASITSSGPEKEPVKKPDVSSRQPPSGLVGFHQNDQLLNLVRQQLRKQRRLEQNKPFRGPDGVFLNLREPHISKRNESTHHKDSRTLQPRSSRRPWERSRYGNEEAIAEDDHRSKGLCDDDIVLMSPKTVIGKGNSDPFGTFSIDINPRANSMISFFRDSVLSSLYHTTSKKWLTSASAVRDFQDNIDALSDEGAAYGFLARYTLIAAALNPNLQELAITYRYKSIKLLRERTATENSIGDVIGSDRPPSLFLMWHIFLLYATELAARNLSGTIAHAKMLRMLFDRQAKFRQVDYKLLNYVLYNDQQMAAIFLTPPVFDPREWTPRMFKGLWEMAETKLPEPSPSIYVIDPSIESEELRFIFSLRRRSLNYWLMNQTNELPESPLMLAWMISKSIICQNRLVLYFRDMRELSLDSSLSPQERHAFEIQQYIALSALHWSRSFNYNTSICGVPVYDASPGILAKLEYLLVRSKRLGGDPPRWDNVRLWALYNGAWSAHAAKEKSKTAPDPYSTWFNVEFVAHATKMGLTTWESIQKILKGFLYSPFLRPDGSIWVEKALNREDRLV